MKVWFDCANAPQATFFVAFRQYVEAHLDDVEWFVTARNQSNTLDILKNHDVHYVLCGGPSKGTKLAKILNLVWRSMLLTYLVHREGGVSLGVTQSSFYLPIVCRILKVRSIYTNDNEKAKGNIIASFFASILVFPEVTQKYFNKSKKTQYYRGIKEQAYVRLLFRQNAIEKRIQTKVFYRAEPWNAQYVNTSSDIYQRGLLKFLHETFQSEIVVSCRSEEQLHRFQQLGVPYVTATLDTYDWNYIANNFAVIVSGGGTMAREFCLLPDFKVYNCFPDQNIAVDEYCINNGWIGRIKVEDGCFKITHPSVDASLDVESGNLNNLLLEGLVAKNG